MTDGDWPERSIEDLEAILRRVSSQSDPDIDDNQSLKPGSVMVLFTPTPEGPSIVLTRRSQSVRTHRGEIAFPGGKPELEDKSSVDTAIRETVSSGFRLDIHTGLLKNSHTFEPRPGEVSEVFTTPVSHLDNPANSRSERIIRNGQILDRPCYSYEGRVIWGATARIIDQMLGILNSS